MPSIEPGPPRPVGAVEARINRQPGGSGPATTRPAPALAQYSAALDPGEPPVDTDRVALIRKAIEEGTYPVVPARIADAVIAAGLLLRSAK
jgi:negative regulator of flagellin synthesis FlgM